VIDIFTIGIALILLVLSAFTVYAVNEYTKHLRKAQREYEKAKDLVEDIVLSFNRELKREANKIETVSYRVEGAASKADTGIRRAENIENRFTPLENEVEEVFTRVLNLNAAIDTISSNNKETLEKILSLDLETKLSDFTLSNEKIVQVNTKVQSIETSQEALSIKIAELQEQIHKLSTLAESGIEATNVSSTMPVIPLKRDKAMASLTETEISVLEFLAAEGPKTAPEIKEKVLLSREHTARLMKRLYEEGYLERETGKLPFKYRVKK
jgi:DNA repair exonuclease SbcCD ATPase subunit